eukprot:4924285-Prymnesium_polylepis.1
MARALEWLDVTLVPGFVSGFSRRGAVAGSGVHRAVDPLASGAGYLDGPAPSISTTEAWDRRPPHQRPAARQWATPAEDATDRPSPPKPPKSSPRA